jgi:hypothetical protein
LPKCILKWDKDMGALRKELRTQEWKYKISKTLKGRVPWNKGIKTNQNKSF